MAAVDSRPRLPWRCERKGATVRLVMTSPERDDPDDRPARVLGSLLFADAGEAPVLEAEWVDLVRAIGSGDQGALRELYVRTHRIVFTLILRILKNPLSAEEVTLDVYHDVWRRSAAYDPARGSVVGMDHESGAIESDRPPPSRTPQEARG